MKRVTVLLAAIAAIGATALLISCGGASSAGGNIVPAPTITSVTVSPATATVATGKTATFTAAVTGTGNFSTSVTWTASAGTISSSGVLTAPATAGTVTVTATSTEDSTQKGTATVTVVTPLTSVTVSATSPTVNVGGTDDLSATVNGGTGGATVAWTMSSSSVGSISPASGLATTYTAPATLAASTTVTITATATDVTGTVTGTATISVNRVIAISPNPAYPNNVLYSDFGAAIPFGVNCIGCVSGDVLNVQSSYGGVTMTTIFSGSLNFIGNANIPGPVSAWITGNDGAKSNTIQLTYDGSQNMVAQDTSTGNQWSGEIYYAYSGNGAPGSFSILKFKQDLTPDGSFQAAGFGIAVDDSTHDVLLSTIGGVNVYSPTGQLLDSVTMGSSSTRSLAVDAKGGLACATQPAADTAYCFYPVTTVNQHAQAFPLPDLPQGSQPVAVKVSDASDVAVYCRGNVTFQLYTIATTSSGTTATAGQSFQLTEFTPTDASYWQQYPYTGGWEMVEVGSTLGVMGQVVNADGTVSQELALVNDTNQTLIQYVDLPASTVHIAPDPTNNAVLAEYVDFSGSAPILRFARVDVATGNITQLTSTSTLVPGAGLLVTQDGSHIAVFVNGKADFEPNQ